MNPKSEKSARRVLPLLREVIDPWAQRTREQHPVTCRRGCHSCCYNLTLVSMAEGVAIALKLIEEGTVERYRPQLEIASKAADSLSERDYLAAKTPCAFLQDGECSIYDARPAICRAHLAISDPIQCSPDRPDRQIEVIDTQPVLGHFVIQLHRKVTSIPLACGPLPSLVLAGIEFLQRSPGAFRRWAKKNIEDLSIRDPR